MQMEIEFEIEMEIAMEHRQQQQFQQQQGVATPTPTDRLHCRGPSPSRKFALAGIPTADRWCPKSTTTTTADDYD